MAKLIGTQPNQVPVNGLLGKLAFQDIISADQISDGAGSGLDADLLDGQQGSYYLNASNINAGTLDAARIPNLDATKITTGTLDAARIPALDAGKITSGTLALARIPDLDAAKITTGTLNAARIPDLDAGKITSGTLNAARIPNLDAGKITTGTLDAARIPSIIPNDRSFSGKVTFNKSVDNNFIDLGSGSAIDLSTANYFAKTISSNTTFTLSNTPASGTAYTFTLELTNAGAYAITFWGGVKIPGGGTIVLTASGRDRLFFTTRDGGLNWDLAIMRDIK